MNSGTITFRRAPKPGDTITLNNCMILVAPTGRRRKPKGFAAIIPARELAALAVAEIAKAVNADPKQFGMTAVADQWRLRLTPIREVAP